MGGGTGGSTGGGAGGSPAGDTCTTAQALVPGSSAVVSGTLVGASTDYLAGQCAVGPDRYYTFTLSTSAQISITVTPTTGSFRPAAAIYGGVSGPCATSPVERACQKAPSAGTSAKVPDTIYAPGTYYLVVNSADGSTGSYTLTTTSTTPGTGESCSTIKPMTFSAGSASFGDSTVGHTHDAPPTACGMGGKDLAYSFSTSGTQNLTVSVSGFGSTWPNIYVTSPCTGAVVSGTCALASASGGTATFTKTNLPPGTYTLWVESYSTYAGAFSVSATLTPSGSQGNGGENCSSPTPLVFDQGVATASGRTPATASDVTSTCLGEGGDVVYSFTTTAPKYFSVTVTPATSQYKAVVHLRGPSSTCTAATELTCAGAASPGSSVTTPSTLLSAGTYYLWLDTFSDASFAGPFTLRATLQ